MNAAESNVLKALYKNSEVPQRELALKFSYSLGKINKCIKSLQTYELIDHENRLTSEGILQLEENKPRNAIILAAGYGMRMAPINREVPKGLLEVNGEKLVERLINQLHEKGISDISLVVGFMKESYEYLIDKYNVDLIVNTKYSTHNNLHSLAKVSDRVLNTYVIPCDVWCKYNPFDNCEINSWYMVSDGQSKKSIVRLNSKEELVLIPHNQVGLSMIGICYLNARDSVIIRERITELKNNPIHNDDFWEEALINKDKMFVCGRSVSKADALEIDTYEQLRELDSNSNHLSSDAIDVITRHFGVTNCDITNIKALKKGMTNNSFSFQCKDKKYIMRIPGKGTDQLINRSNEAAVYDVINDIPFLDSAEYINSDNGYKIAKFYENTRPCDPYSVEDVARCMRLLKAFHNKKLEVPETFDIFSNIEFYESLWSENSAYVDYEKTKAEILSLKSFVENKNNDWVLTHIDANPDNFLFIKKNDGEERIKLIDWEYAGMQDPHVDIAMFCIYSGYDKDQTDKVIDLYFDNNCTMKTRMKIYAYMSICGLLWSNWCEYKRQLGIDFGEYSINQYRYAKTYFKIVDEWRLDNV